MPYWNPDKETQTDKHGTPIVPGDVLRKDPPEPPYPINEVWPHGDPWEYHFCYDESWGDRKHWAVRCQNAHNVCMCDLGLNGDVVNLGNWKKNRNLWVFDGYTDEQIEGGLLRNEPCF